MVHPITDGIDKNDHQMLPTVDDIRESDRARTISMVNKSWYIVCFDIFRR